MNQKNYSGKENAADGDILFSKSVKAGNRIYYIDVKQDRKGEYYMSLTESKRLKDQGDGMRPVFEKHKLFLYREDLDKFQQAFEEAADFTRTNAPEVHHYDRAGNEEETSADNYNLEIDFD